MDRSSSFFAIAAALFAFALPAQAESRVVLMADPVDEADDEVDVRSAPQFPNALSPGRARPAGQAQPAAYRVNWDAYETLIVVGAGNGSLRPAWVVTYGSPEERRRGLELSNPDPAAIGQLPEADPAPEAVPELNQESKQEEKVTLVAYRGTAFLDKDGVLHIDARKARHVGPLSSMWSPDSFAITKDDHVYTLDDHQDGKTGTVGTRVSPAGAESAYRLLLSLAQALVEGGT